VKGKLPQIEGWGTARDAGREGGFCVQKSVKDRGTKTVNGGARKRKVPVRVNPGQKDSLKRDGREVRGFANNLRRGGVFLRPKGAGRDPCHGPT